MEFALLATAALMGLAGGAHCLAMCSAGCAAVARSCSGSRPERALLALLAGRAAAYAAGGALVAASVGLLAQWSGSVAWLRPLWSMLHLAALALGLWLLWAGRQPAWMSALGQGALRRGLPWLTGRSAGAPGLVPGAALAVGVPMIGLGRQGTLNSGTAGSTGAARAALAGSMWVLLPCGLLQSALLVAALASTPLSGAAVMLVFALASSLSLWAGPALWFRLAGRDGAARWQGAAIRACGLALAAASVWALAQGWGAGGAMNAGDVCLPP
jgi:uncharacterized protein